MTAIWSTTRSQPNSRTRTQFTTAVHWQTVWFGLYCNIHYKQGRHHPQWPNHHPRTMRTHNWPMETAPYWLHPSSTEYNNSNQEACHNAYQINKIPELIQYLHSAAFSSPVISTRITAIQRGFFQSWPGLTTAAINKHLLKSEATMKGHINQTRTNIQSTKTKEATIES
jgi:hypothetical protein